jgi:hypothetical protein
MNDYRKIKRFNYVIYIILNGKCFRSYWIFKIFLNYTAKYVKLWQKYGTAIIFVKVFMQYKMSHEN